MQGIARYSKLVVAVAGVISQAVLYYSHGHEWGQLAAAGVAAVLVGLVPNVPSGVKP